MTSGELPQLRKQVYHLQGLVACGAGGEQGGVASWEPSTRAHRESPRVRSGQVWMYGRF